MQRLDLSEPRFASPDNGAVIVEQCISGASQVVLVVKNPPAKAGDIRDEGSFPGSGSSPGGGHGNHSSILAWRISWTEEPGRIQFIVLYRVGHD